MRNLGCPHAYVHNGVCQDCSTAIYDLTEDHGLEPYVDPEVEDFLNNHGQAPSDPNAAQPPACVCCGAPAVCWAHTDGEGGGPDSGGFGCGTCCGHGDCDDAEFCILLADLPRLIEQRDNARRAEMRGLSELTQLRAENAALKAERDELNDTLRAEMDPTCQTCGNAFTQCQWCLQPYCTSCVQCCVR